MKGRTFQERADLLARFRSQTFEASPNTTETFQITINSLEELKELFHVPEEVQTDNLDSAPVSLNDSLEKRLLQKTILYAWEGRNTFEGEEKKWVESAFPLTLPVVQLEEYVIDQDLNIDNQAFYIGNLGKVTLKPDKCINVINTHFEFNADEFVREGDAPTGKGDFNIIGKKGEDGKTGGIGAPGAHGRPGNGGNCSSAGVAGDPGEAGGNAEAAEEGKEGSRGIDGYLPPKAAIKIKQRLIGRLIISSQTGAGGNGGTGGAGGKGGNGGNGGNGATCMCTGSRGGNGGNAGRGGKGGQGGDGGNGGDGRGATGVITVSVPGSDADKVSSIELVSAAGTGGTGGTGGDHGTPGSGGLGGKYNDKGSGGLPVIPDTTASNYGKADNGTAGNNGKQGYPIPITIKTR